MEWDLQIEQLPMIFVEQSSEDATNHNIIIVDLEVAKTSLLYKWIVKVMEPGESNLQLMLRYKLARFNPQRGRSWGISLD